MRNKWQQETAEVLTDLQTDEGCGLSAAAVEQRLAQYGPNALVEQGGNSPWVILLAQFTSLMVLLLIGAAVVSGAVLGEWEDAAVILIVVVLNATFGFHQEYSAEQAMAALKKLGVPRVRVRRDGTTTEVPARALVPGDIVLLEAGNVVPADMRLVEACNLRVQESTLTGEAEPVEKNVGCCERHDLPLGDRSNMAYMGTVVTYGRGTAVVTATGMQTELGRIATMIQQAGAEKTILQQKLDQLSKGLVVVALVLIGIVVLQGWLILDMGARAIFMTAVSMAVAAIPEGLPAVLTIALALGAQRMLKRRALIRRLPAVETLGSVTVICSDKTGTLTQNRMTVTEIELPACELDLPSAPHLRAKRLQEELEHNASLGLLLAGAGLCNDAVVKPGKSPGEFEILGDPTEGALVVAAGWVGWSKEQLASALTRVNELPFDSERKRMTTIHAMPEDVSQLPASLRVIAAWIGERDAAGVGFTKGAVDSVLERATQIWLSGRSEPLTTEWRQRLVATNETLAADGIRVLGVAMRAAPALDERGDALEQNLVYLGMVGMLDPLRPEVRPAIKTCRAAGIRPIMITGDHPLIARNIAADLGFAHGHRFLTGNDLAAMHPSALENDVEKVSVYARVAPEHKLNIVAALQNQGHVVAMTGDGVNDAPALKEADIGVAMGITGTDVSKEASDMVLQDDNFATIVDAVEEGRTILDNIIRFVRFILASNCAEVLVMLLAPLFGMPLPLLPVQILWMNLVTDGLPALALGVEPADLDVMRRPPRNPQAPIINRSMALHILWVGALMAGLSLALGYVCYDPAQTIPMNAAQGHGVAASVPWQTVVFTVLVFSQLFLVLAERSGRNSLFQIGFFSNPYVVGAVTLTLGLQLAVTYIPFLQRFFKSAPLSFCLLLACMLASGVIFAAVEGGKWMRRRGGQSIVA